MKFTKLGALAMALALLAGDAFAQSRGNLRITGRVLDETGKPIADAQVRAAKRTETKPEIFSAKTNDKGEYSIDGLAAGEWVLEGMKEGIGAKEASATLTDGTRTTTVDITITKAAAPKADPSAEIQASHQQAVQLWQAGKPAEAKKIYEDLLVKYPTVYQLNVPLANIYAEEKNYARAIELMKIAVDKDPANVDWQVLYGEMVLESGDREAGTKLLQAVDITKVKDHRAFTNLAINYINSGKAVEAVDLLTKLIAQFPTEPALLYYRGRAHIAATKLPEAKADLEKFVAAAPAGAPQLADANKLLAQLNKK